MSPSPIANRSFLHGDRKTFSTSEKIVYATLDSLALKRTRLPLQLLPGDGSRLPRKSERNVAPDFSVRSKVEATRYSDGSSISAGGAENEPSEEAATTPPSASGDRVGLPETAEESKTDEERVDLEASEDDDDVRRSVYANVAYSGGEDARRESLANDPCTDESDYERIEVAAVHPDGTSDDREPIHPGTRSFSESRLDRRASLEKKRSHFARNVLQLVPGQLVKPAWPRRVEPSEQPGTTNKKKKKKKKKRRRKRSPSSSSNSWPTGPTVDSTIEPSPFRSRTLSREELKCLTISSPTNFVHVASATSSTLVSDESIGRSGSEQLVITHEQKCATLPLLVGRDERRKVENENDARSKVFLRAAARKNDRKDEGSVKPANLRGSPGIPLELQTAPGKVLEERQPAKTEERRSNASQEGSRELLANSSFLWSVRARNLREVADPSRSPLLEDEEDLSTDRYDDVGPLALDSQDDYDDVGAPTTILAGASVGGPFSESSDEIYDDVAAPKESDGRNDSGSFSDGAARAAPSIDLRVREISRRTEKDTAEEDHYLSIDNDYSSVEEEEPEENEEEDTDETDDEDGEDGEQDRDDQGLYDDVGPPGEERVNSLYAGSAPGSIRGLASINGKESEWEDLEDPAICSSSPSRRSESWKVAEVTTAWSKKKPPSQRWSRKTKRQRSRASRKLSKSLSRSSRRSKVYVAVSLAGGSILLLGHVEKIERRSGEKSAASTEGKDSTDARALVLLRVIDLDEDADTQEATCYVDEDDASDDSTYESLRSFRADCEADPEGGSERAPDEERTRNDRAEAPTRPNPPPPREASLTQTLGRRIKMLRRTWSITKGSLGRMRRRTSIEEDRNGCPESRDSDAGRYFGFGRHFRKSVTGLSTFYLDGAVAGNEDAVGPIYGNAECQSGMETGEESLPAVREDLDHYSVLADQEPLYQFYAAAAARVAFGSDSDGYEEVEGTVPSRATTDLAKPGYRTLWCQTPPVLNGGLLQRLTAEERKIQEAKFEILTSEASYLNSLRVLKTEFLDDAAFAEDLLTANEREKLFGSVPQVLRASEEFLAELEASWRRDPMLPDLPAALIDHAEKCLDVYVGYCSNQVGIDATLKDLRARKGQKFLDAISRIEARPSCQSLSLHSFLMLPMQRVTRLPLLADAVLSRLSVEHADRLPWEKVLSSLSYVVAECNEGARTAAKDAEMEVLARKLEYSAKIKPVVLKGRFLVRSGPVVQLLTKADAEYKLTFGKRFNKTPLHLFLLTDYLLVTKLKSNTQDESYAVIDTCKRSLIALESVTEDSPFAGRNAMLLTLLENQSGRQAEYILTCDSDTERQRWLEAVSPSKRGLVGETLYEAWDCPQVVALYSYSPNQPDELPLQPGDVINVLRKMTDGWYHGEKLLDCEQGWFPGNYTKEVASEHVRARNLKQRHRLFALNGSVLHRKAKQQSAIY